MTGLEGKFVDFLILGFSGLASLLMTIVLGKMNKIDDKINDLAVDMAKHYITKEEAYHEFFERRGEDRRKQDIGRTPDWRRHDAP